ncbi:MAG: DHH family phosphoesterase [Methanomicrobiales archaeon]|nr:DHH family phosphoesterase [Methanomicrobiales archaeon]MDI6877052.1 DHH family phosphoesterase [Methanomicrobiales archaeon]
MGLSADISRAADIACSRDRVTIVSHIDADGITGEAILAQALVREGVEVRSLFVRQLEPLTMRTVPRDDTLKIFTDLGAGQQNLLQEHGLDFEDVLILDHHVSQPCDTPYRQVNGLTYGHSKLSAAGIAYLVAKAISSANVDLAKLAVVGNVGDMMAREDCRLVGPAREMVNDGVECGSIQVLGKTLNCYGISTRPVHIALAYNDDPFVPGISNNPQGALNFLQKLGVRLKSDGGQWMVWEELSFEDKRTITSALVQQLIAHGIPHSRLFAEAYIFPTEVKRTPLRNASEFATLLNACGRWAKPMVGSTICKGDRGKALRDAEYMLTHHRAIIRDLLEFILDRGVHELEHIQHIHVADRFPDTIIGIGAGMALSRLNWKKPILIMCQLPEDPGITKVSMRATEWAVARGVDLQAALIEASAACAGAAGGHRIAAGAFIPKDAEEVFVSHVNRIIGEQYAQTRAHDR